MKKLVKAVTILSLAAIFAANLFTIPVNAKTKVKPSLDNVVDVNEETLITLPANDTDLTIGLAEKYLVKLTDINFSEEALDAGFRVVNKYTIGFNGETYPVKWVASDPSYVSVTPKGTIKSAKLTSQEVKVNAVVSQSVFSKGGINYTFKDNVIATVNVTVVPEADLQAYFLGVWKESKADTDATHLVDYAVNSANVNDQLKVMSELVNTAHIKGTFKAITYTKTDDGKVRAYIITNNVKAGLHYYILVFSTFDGVNNINIYARDYCDGENNFKYVGEFFRDKVVD